MNPSERIGTSECFPARRCAFPNVYLFCDEAGNTGSNYLDPSQPVHVLAGFLIPEILRPRVVELVEVVRRAYPQAQEVKGSKLLRTDKGRRLLADFIEGALKTGCLPVYLMWEKRFCAAAKIVETFLDPVHNPRADWLPTGANLSRQKVAHIFYELPDKYLVEFVEAYRRPSVDAMRKSIESLGLALDLLGHQHLASAIRGNLLGLDDLVDAERFETETVRHSVSTSLNYPSFAHFLGSADSLLEANGDVGHVVHDETKEFEPAFQWIFNSVRNAKKADTSVVLEDGTPVRFGIAALKSFRTGKSLSEPELQAADFLATALKGLSPISQESLQDCPQTERIARALLPLLMIYESGKLLGSEKFIGALVRPLAAWMQEIRDSEASAT